MTEAAYVRAVRACYLQLSDAHRFSRSDRSLASILYRRGIPLDIIRSALLLGDTRRLCRNPAAPALPPVRSLHYFLPVIDETLLQPLPTGYVEYLQQKLIEHKKAGHH